MDPAGVRRGMAHNGPLLDVDRLKVRKVRPLQYGVNCTKMRYLLPVDDN